MATPPGSPAGGQLQQRPMSAMIRPNRSSSRLSTASRQGGSRASDDENRTAVKVAVRVRPPLMPSDPGFDLVPQRFRSSTCHVTSPTSLSVEAAQGKKLFVFDRVFGEDVQQEGVWEYLSDSVNSFVQGYNVSILAYGQSGAGKSYTMGTTGPKEQGDTRLMGVVPRAATALFEKLTGPSGGKHAGSGIRAPSRYSMHASMGGISKPPADRSWQMKATYVEIYNEQLRDLLLDDSIPMTERQQVSIREDTKGRILLTGLKQVNINSIEDLLGALNFGSSIRQTDATAVNAKSSRSHAVFSLNLIQKKTKSTPVHERRLSMPIESMSGSEGTVTTDSKLHFVDLAGSERLKNTGAYGDRAKEGISINGGLASLGKVISQLSSRAAGSHVSYRDSRLTRLLQDSLGGNAITYMIACVNPVEFHLSETLNTVQYAQRARAIQVKPQIQQIHDDGDKQAIIERLRAEISFLRDQIRLSERTERRNNAPQERAERMHEREVELQNQLLDVQENYSALSQRHAKLISEIAKARDPESGDDMPTLKDAIGDSALERLKRSTSFGEAVEQVVLEYEKTIQSLEASLSNTRSSLSTSESSLLEKETKIAYMETAYQQLQSRFQKVADREANNESYLKELEARVDGVTSGEEKTSAIVQDLRKELARTKENEASCEEYISTLEERLAEAEQDHESMQREIDRLEHVVERQRSIGKLDNLLFELDNIRTQDPRLESPTLTNGHSENGGRTFLSSVTSPTSEYSTMNGEVIPEEDEYGRGERLNPVRSIDEVSTPTKDDGSLAPAHRRPAPAEEVQSPAQSKFMADKLDTVTQELFDLRVDHETTVLDYEELARKYQIALNTLHELQDAVEEARSGTARGGNSGHSSRPTSFLAGAGVNGQREEGGQPSSSRTLSSELSSLGESTNASDPDETLAATGITEPDAAQARAGAAEAKSSQESERLAEELEDLRRLNNEKEAHMAELNQSYVALEEQHKSALQHVEDLKAQVQKAQSAARPGSPTTHVIRRKSSQTQINTDRATRSLASLRNLALENFEDQPEVIQNFEMNLNAIMTEMHIRSERVQSLETEAASVRKELEGKMAMISGLTRERSTMKGSSSMDISVVSSMRDQLIESEGKLRTLQETHAAREKELQKQIAILKEAAVTHHPSLNLAASPARDGDIFTDQMALSSSHTNGTREAVGDEPERVQMYERQVGELQGEIAGWKSKHLAEIEKMKSSEQQLLSTIRELEASVKKAEELQKEQVATLQKAEGQRSRPVDEDVVENLREEIEVHKAAAAANATRVAELEEAHAEATRKADAGSTEKSTITADLQAQRDLVASLGRQIDDHKAKLASHEESVRSLQDSQARELEGLRSEMSSAAKVSNERLAEQLAQHQENTVALQKELERARAEHKAASETLEGQLAKAKGEMEDILRSASGAFDEPVDTGSLSEHIRDLAAQRKTLLEQHAKAVSERDMASRELEGAKTSAANLENKVGELKAINDETLQELQRVSEKERKSSRLVEELEEQLNTNYDQHQVTNNRLSALQSQNQFQLQEALAARSEMEHELEESRIKIATLEALVSDGRRGSPHDSLNAFDINNIPRSSSSNANLRKSASHTSLPSPPPAIPLPPLPPGSPSPMNNPASPPASRHQSKDIAHTQMMEDQEARIRTIEKHLFAEKQLTATLEEALTDLENSSQRMKGETESWRKKCQGLEQQLEMMQKERALARHSLQAVEEERNARMRVEAERAHLEARMNALNASTKKGKKKNPLNCF